MTTNKIQNTGLTSLTTGISAASVNNGAGSLGSAIDLSAAGSRDMNIVLELTATEASSPVLGAPWYVWLIPAFDGTNYTHSSAIQLGRNPDAILRCDVATAQIIGYGTGRPDNQILAAPAKFKFLLWNASGQNATGVTLKAWSYTPDIQAAA